MPPNRGEPEPPEDLDALVGDSGAMAAVRQAIERLARVDSTVLLVGETGTGKELVARLIHHASARSNQPFVALGCTSVAPESVEGSPFGQVQGVVHETAGRRTGRLEEAEGGTLLLDEVGDLPLGLQPRLLRFLEDRAANRHGEVRLGGSDIRVIATTQRNLRAASDAGLFRPDLFHRLAALPLEIPPLRAHPEDLPQLTRHFILRIGRRLGRPPVIVGDAAMAALVRYPFPGNVRELENVLEQALVLGAGGQLAGDVIDVSDLPAHVRARGALPVSALPLDEGLARLRELHAQLERDVITRAVRAWPHLSNTQIAARLGTNRRVLELRMKQYGVVKPRTADLESG